MPEPVVSNSKDLAPRRLPSWLRRPPGSSATTMEVKKLLRSSKLNTVCEEARCPNIAECFGRGTATFMILGDVCTRGCRFCSVHTGRPAMPETDFVREAESVAEAADNLGLKHVVVTSVARDDLADGGASGFEKTIAALRDRIPGITIEVLVPDFRGDIKSLEKVIAAEPEVFNHNLETVPRLYRRVRPGAQYQRSISLLSDANKLNPKIKIKTGIMLGLGEETSEVSALMEDAYQAGVSIFTAGQYLQPERKYLPVERYLKPAEFEDYERKAKELGFRHVAIGPLVRSSYMAESHLA